jgi:transposase
MSTLDYNEILSVQERQSRSFSEEFKRQKVSDIEKGLISVAQLARDYQVSKTAIRKWLYKYSPMKKKKEKIVYETESDALRVKQLQDRIRELERAVGQKQLKIDFLEKMIEIAEEDLKIDIKKKHSTKPSTGSERTEKH